jgi:DNA invertase Pin-like site-specific DNA recombinase
LIFHIFSALVEFERDVIRDRTRAGLVAARARAHVGGRPALLAPKQVVRLKKIYDARKTQLNKFAKYLPLVGQRFTIM